MLQFNSSGHNATTRNPSATADDRNGQCEPVVRSEFTAVIAGAEFIQEPSFENMRHASCQSSSCHLSLRWLRKPTAASMYSGTYFLE